MEIILKTKNKESFIEALKWLKNIESTYPLTITEFAGVKLSGYAIPRNSLNEAMIHTIRQDLKIKHDGGHVSFYPIQSFITSESEYFIERKTRDLSKTLDDVYDYFDI